MATGNPWFRARAAAVLARHLAALGTGDVLAQLSATFGEDRWVMKWPGAAPCKGHSPPTTWTTSPGDPDDGLAAAGDPCR